MHISDHERDNEHGTTSNESLAEPQISADHPTAVAPDSVEKSVYDEAAWAGKQGPDAASPPTAAMKSQPTEPSSSAEPRGSSGEELAEGSDLEPDEAADVMETQLEAERIKDARDDTQDEDLISLDVPD